MSHVTLIDYGMGNLCSVQSALEYVGTTIELTDDVSQVVNAETIVLPGVGSFSKAMQTLRDKGLDAAIRTAVEERGAKVLGICLGMQLLGSHSNENGETDGLNLIPNGVERFRCDPAKSIKIPHVGFNSVELSEAVGLFEGLPQHCDFYFVHSYRMLPELIGQHGRIGMCEYGESFMAAFEYGNICGTQFHPEKSQTNGLRLLKNFIR